jgi:hypothetical protein
MIEHVQWISHIHAYHVQLSILLKPSIPHLFGLASYCPSPPSSEVKQTEEVYYGNTQNHQYQ